MKIKPIVKNYIQTRHTSFKVDLMLETNITFITGESGSGKTTLYSILLEYATDDNSIRCFNYLDYNKAYISSIKRSKGKLFVIDNADILLDDKMRSYIAFDDKNQYIIIGRNPTGLQLTVDEIFGLKSETVDCVTIFSLKKSF